MMQSAGNRGSAGKTHVWKIDHTFLGIFPDSALGMPIGYVYWGYRLFLDAGLRAIYQSVFQNPAKMAKLWVKHMDVHPITSKLKKFCKV